MSSLTNPIGFYLEKSALDSVFKHDMLSRFELINSYIRCFRIGLTRKEVGEIEIADQKNYYLKYLNEGVIFATWEELVPKGRIGWIPDLMARLLQDCFDMSVNCDHYVQRVLIQCIIISHRYLVTDSPQYYDDILASLIKCRNEMPVNKASTDGTVALNSLEKNLSRLEVIGPDKFEELVKKLVDHSTTANAPLPNEFEQ
jgi:hypothetical protein